MDQDKSQARNLLHALADPGRLREVLLDAWQRTRMDWSFARDGLIAMLRKQAGLGASERRAMTEVIYGMIRHLRRLDEALVAGGVARRTAGPPPDLQRIVAYLVLEAELPSERAAALVPGVDWARARLIDDVLGRESRVTRRIALRCSLPDWLAEALVASHGDRAEAMAHAFQARAPMTLRANTLTTSRADLATWLAEEGVPTRPTRHARAGLIAADRSNLFTLRAFERGAFELQDEGSQMIAELVAPPPRSVVVDYCAGAGGKTLALAALLGNRGRVVAVDVDARKLHELRRRTRRAGVGNVQAVTLERDGGWPPALATLEGTVARVLVDAPCSGVGTLRRHPEIRWRLSPDEVARYPELQAQLVERALSLLAPGGHLVYATCTVLAPENQAVVERVLAAHPNFSLVPVRELAPALWGAVADASDAPAGPGEVAAAGAGAPPRLGAVDAVDDLDDLTWPDGRYLRLDPARHDTDGFFAAVLRRDI
jgi:16S rRNA (cytosine967-C5)-methyltransferase